MKCVHTFGTGRHKRQAGITFLFQYISGEMINMYTNVNKQLSYSLSFVHCRLNVTFEPRHEISNNVVCVTSKGSDQPAHMRSLIRPIASRLNIQ